MCAEEEVKLADGLLSFMFPFALFSLPIVFIYIYGSFDYLNGFSSLFFIEENPITGSFGTLN
jgi:hypothetical protein